MPVMVKALGYYSHKSAGGLAKVKSHLKYLEHGKEHDNQPRGFSDREERVSRGEFMERIQEQPSRGVIAHKLVFSLSQDERDRCGVDMKEMVRETMSSWGQSLGRPLHWIGFEHDDPGHPHVHVVVGGYAQGRQVGMYERDITRLRGWAERDKTRQLEHSRPVDPLRTIVKEIDRLIRGTSLERGLDRDLERGMERERERERGR